MTEVPLPSNVGTGTVTARLVTAQKATASGNEVQVAATGKVIFTPNVKPGQPLLNCNATPKLMIVPQPVTVDVQADGSVSMVLISNQDPDLNPTGWNWTATFQLGGGTKLNPITFDLPIGSTVDLADVAQVVPQAGTMILRGAGVPAGGATGQVLTKASDTDDDTEWATPASGTGGTADWNTLADKPAVIAAGTDEAAARSAIGLGSAATASATDFAPVGSVPAAYQTAINNAVAAVINGAPGALDTLKELADALGDDANYAATITNQLALKANSADVPGALSQLSGKVGVTQVIPGGVLSVGFTSANYQSLARPTSRTDVRVWWIGDSTTGSTTIPVNSLSGDIVDTKSA